MADPHLILFDGACGFCRRTVRWLLARDAAGRFTAIPYQEAPSPPMTPALADACRRAVHVVRADGGILRGGRAVLFILEHTGMGAPARALALPPFVWLVELGYRAVAGNRSLLGRIFPSRAACGFTPIRPPDRRPVMFQQWRCLTFLHWPVEGEALRRLLPPGLELDTFQGQAFVGLVPFTMRNVRPAGLPAVPALSHFHEFNVRTYVLDRHGRPGVWFFSLDAGNKFAAALARRWFKLPYFHAEMALEAPAPDQRRYRSARLEAGPVPPGCELTTTFGGPAGPAVPGTLAHFLIERYVLFAWSGTGLLSGQVHHRPYPIRPATAQLQSESLLAAADILRPESAPLVHYSDGVDVEVFGLLPVD
jgi:hypothetical protein